MKSITFVVVMQRLVTSILVMALLVALATGCGRARYDARLVQADSLMWTAPDSALATLAAIDSLAGEANQAYRDLLMTQARYKCYADITASDDSAITRAMDYYRAHSGQREKVTRACLYKGAVMEELGHVDSAMYYYKTAEAAADPTDYLNLGQINTRIADLYRLYYADSQTCYDKFEQALKYYELTGNKRLQFDCLLNMGACSGITRIGEPDKLLAQASQLAIELKDSAKFYKSQELLCRQLIYSNDSLSVAKRIAFHCLKDYRRFITEDLLLDIADIYTKSRMPDSARYYLNYVNENAMNNQGQIRTRKYLALSKIHKIEGDTAQSNHYDKLAHQVSDSLLNNKQKYLIQQTENTGNFTQIERRRHAIIGLHNLLASIIVIAIMALAAFGIYHYSRMQRINAIIDELPHANISKHEELLEQIKPQNAVITQFIENIVSFMQTTINSSEHDSPSVIRKRIREGINNLAASDDFWKALKSHLDQNHDGIISKFEQMYSLKEKDLKFLELTCCGFSHAEIAIILNYSPKYVFSKRKILAQKMGLDMPLQDYVNSLMGKNQQD